MKNFGIKINKFMITPTMKDYDKITKFVNRLKTDIKEGSDKEEDRINAIINIYAMTAIDEGIRKALSELKHKSERRRKKDLVYGNIELAKSLSKTGITQKRINSKHLLNSFKATDADDTEFILAMIMISGFEYGYMKMFCDTSFLIDTVVRNDELIPIMNDLVKHLLDSQELDNA